MSTEECNTGSECCYRDDSGAQSLKHACVGLSAALVLALLALTWVAVGRKYLNRDVVKENPTTAADGQNGGAAGARGEGSGDGGTEQNNSSGERTRTGSPDSVVAEAKMRRQVSELSLRSLRSSRSLDNMELQPRTYVEPPSPASTVAADDITRLRLLLDSERSRRVAAENFLGRRATTPSSLGTPGARGSMRAFPTPRAVEGHALEAAANAAKWAQSAATRAGASEPELPSLIKCVLVHLFQSCRAEIRRRLAVRLAGLQAFVGDMEPVYLGGNGVGMTGDTQDLLLGELRKRFNSIAAVGRKDLVKLSARVLAKALETEPQKELGRMLVHQTWPFFEPLVRSYLALFVECALQQPPIEFEDVTGKEEMFDPANHRELARFMEPNDTEINSTCCIVFPSTLAAKAKWPPSDTAKSGVIIWSQKYFKL